jgi:hypothetical protein
MSSVAGAMVAASQAQTQTSLAATFLKQNASAEAGLVAVLEQNAEMVAAAAKAPPAAGMGGRVDVTA